MKKIVLLTCAAIALVVVAFVQTPREVQPWHSFCDEDLFCCHVELSRDLVIEFCEHSLLPGLPHY